MIFRFRKVVRRFPAIVLVVSALMMAPLLVQVSLAQTEGQSTGGNTSAAQLEKLKQENFQLLKKINDLGNDIQVLTTLGNQHAESISRLESILASKPPLTETIVPAMKGEETTATEISRIVPEIGAGKIKTETADTETKTIEDTTEKATEDVTGEKPAAVFPEMAYDFGSALDGAEVTHDYIVQNKGDAELKITKVRSG